MTILNRLNFNFDTTKFGTATDPDGTLSSTLASAYPIISTATTATYSAVVSSNTANSTYYQNPVADICGQLVTVLNSAHSLFYNAYINVDDGEGGYTPVYQFQTSNLSMYYNQLIQELSTADSNTNHNPLSFNTFISHTNRLSNLDKSNKANRPDFSSGLGVCQTVQKIVYQNEKSLTTTATIAGLGLGCFTSLFINSDLTTHYNGLVAINSTATSLLSTEPLTSVTTAMTDNYNAFIQEMSSLLSLVTYSRINDESFYTAATSIVSDVGKVNSLVNYVSNPSLKNPAQKYLIDNFVGTTAFNQFRTG
jgi:hypothetical protein